METPAPSVAVPPPVQMPVRNYLAFSILTALFCCLPFGIIGVIYAIQTDAALLNKNEAAARYFSDKARFWAFLALWIGIGIFVLYALYAGFLITAGVSSSMHEMH